MSNTNSIGWGTVCALFCGICAFSCNEDFTPKGAFERKLVLHGILSTDRDTQYVRVNSTYDTPDFDPLANADDPQVSDATVTLTASGKVYVLRDTLLLRSDTTRYQSLIHSYFVAGLTPLPNESFLLHVVSPALGMSVASITLPGRATVEIPNPLIVQEPSKYPTKDILVNLLLHRSARGYILRMFVEYEIIPNSIFRVEVPLALDGAYDPPAPVYPDMTRGAPDGALIDSYSITHVISRQAYYYALSTAKRNLTKLDLRFKRAIFVVYSIDKNLYIYYNLVHGFRDPFSIRTDLQDFSNIQGGVGVLGGCTVDSAIVDLKDTWID
jgi:hypothetical protein